MKSILKTVLLAGLLSIVLIGCSDSGGDGDSVKTLSLYSTMTNQGTQDIFDGVIADFEEENPGIKIDANYPAGEYEKLLRVKMGANDMPDLFDTHGWAKNRYGEYTMDQGDMDWVGDLDPALDDIFSDEDGKYYAYPLNQAKDGFTYNKEVLDEYGIDAPKTFDKFMKALHTIKEKSNGEVTPLWFGGSEGYTIAQFLDEMGTPLLITNSEHDYSEELLDGSFDWSHYTFLPEKLKEMQEDGLINEDVLTAKPHQKNRLLAQGKIGFVAGTTTINVVRELNPDAELGVMPVPSIHDGGVQSWIGGERHTLAIWKDTKYPQAAKKFIDYLAQPDVVKTVAEATALPAGLTNTDVDIYYQPYYDTYSDIKVEPYFDRVFLPSGMWDPMGITAQELLSGDLTPEGVSQDLSKEYKRLLDQEESE